MAVVTVLISWRFDFTLCIARVCLSFSFVGSLCVPLLGHCHSVLDNLLLIVALLGSLAVTQKTASEVAGLWGNWLKVVGRHPTFSMSRAIKRDQVYHSSNKRGCFIEHPAFGYIQIWSLQFHCPPQTSPPPLIGLSMSWMSIGLRAKVWMTVMMSPHPLVAKTLVRSVWMFLTLTSIQTLREWLISTFTKVIRLSNGIRFVYAKREWFNHLPFWLPLFKFLMTDLALLKGQFIYDQASIFSRNRNCIKFIEFLLY